MTRGITTIIRLSQELQLQLEYLAHSMHKGKNWIINQALQEFIDKQNLTFLVEEARRQSLLASSASSEEDGLWEQEADTTGWEA